MCADERSGLGRCRTEQTLAGAPRTLGVRGSGIVANDQNPGKSIMNLTRPFLAAFVAASMLLALGCSATPTQESTGEYLDDSTITTKVKTAIFNEPSLKVAQINVKTYKSVVQLSGFVDSYAEAYTAGSVARAVKGVAHVDNDLKVK